MEGRTPVSALGKHRGLPLLLSPEMIEYMLAIISESE